MAIQFPCSGCDKQIEVDEELSGQLAMCPYCQGTVQVPQSGAPAGEAEFAPQPVSPQTDTSTPAVQPLTSAQIEAVLPYAPPQGPLMGNPAGNWGLALSLMAWAGILVMTVWLFFQITESPLLADDVEPTQELMQQAIEETMEDEEVLRVTTTSGLVITLFALAGVVVSIMGLTRLHARKGTAIAGLLIGGPLLMCQLLAVLARFGGD